VKTLEDLIRTTSRLRAQHWQMEPLLKNILDQVAYLVGVHSAMIAVQKNDRYERLLAIGNLCDGGAADKYLENVPDLNSDDIYQTDEFAYFNLHQYGILAIFDKGGKPLNQERTYLVRLFLEQAIQSIRNVGLQDELLKKEKLSAVGEASSMIVHDLRNSIGSIELAIELIVEQIDDKAFVVATLDLIKQAAGNGIALAKDILDFSGNKTPEKFPIDGRVLADDIEKTLRPVCEKSKVKMTVACPEMLPFSGDYSKLYRVLFNLTNNAVESFADKGHPNPEITVSMKRGEDDISIIVSDNGDGIPDKIADKLFTPFATHGKSGGTGLGLAITKQIIDAHGGNISVGSSAEGGAEFTITLPVA
jgi:signal transduction histidine kinase